MKREHLLVLLLSIVLALIILLANFRLIVFNENYYRKNVTSEQALDNVLNFLKNKEELNPEVFKEEEIEHMKDVRTLIKRIFYLFYFLIFLFIVLLIFLIKTSKKPLKYIGFILISGSSIIIILSLLLYLANFSNLFTNFHLVFFPQGNWMFPSDYMLIKLFSESFFYDISFRIIRNSLVSAVLLVIFGFYFVVPKTKHLNICSP